MRGGGGDCPICRHLLGLLHAGRPPVAFMNSFMHQSESAYWAGREGPHATGWDDSSAPLGNSATRLSLHTQRGTASARLNLARSASEPRTQRERAGIFTRWATRWICRSRLRSGALLTPRSALPSVPTFDEAVGTIANTRQSKWAMTTAAPVKTASAGRATLHTCRLAPATPDEATAPGDVFRPVDAPPAAGDSDGERATGGADDRCSEARIRPIDICCKPPPGAVRTTSTST